MPGQAIVLIKDKQWTLAVANTYTELTTGLSGVESIPAGTGMLFDLGVDYKTVQIDMTRMLFPLDIVFINSTQGVVWVIHNVQPGWTDVRLENNALPGARCFLEVNASEAEGIEIGDDVAVEGYVRPAQLDISSLLNFMVIMLVIVMMFKVVDRSLAPPREHPVLYGPGGERLMPQTQQPQRLPAVAPREGVYSWLITDPETGEIMIKPGYAAVSKAKRAAMDFALRRARYAGEHPVKLRIYDRDPDIDNLEQGVVYEGRIVIPGGKIVEGTHQERLPATDDESLTPRAIKEGKHPYHPPEGVPAEVYPVRAPTGEGYSLFDMTEGVWFGRRSDTYGEAVQRADRENRRLWEAHKALHSETAVIPVEPRRRPHRKDDLEYFADSPEFLSQTIDATGYRSKIDTTFQEAIARAKGLKETE